MSKLWLLWERDLDRRPVLISAWATKAGAEATKLSLEKENPGVVYFVSQEKINR